MKRHSNRRLASPAGHRDFCKLMAMTCATICATAAETIYFVAASSSALPPERGAFVIPLSSPEEIQIARSSIAREGEWWRNWISAKVVRGADHINRNYLDPTLPEWRWHVSEFWGFGRNNINEGGFAFDVEREVDGMGTFPYFSVGIHFYDYTVVRELGPNPLFMGSFRTTNGAMLYWTTPGGDTNAVYILERTESIVIPRWRPLEGGAWPLATNRWPLADSLSGYFRVIAISASHAATASGHSMTIIPPQPTDRFLPPAR